jgi:hypothetical protein
VRALAVIIALTWPAIARSESSPIAVGQSLMFGVDLARASGSRPRSLELSPRFQQTALSFHVRGGVTGRWPDTVLGTQLGVQWSFELGLASEESGAATGIQPLGAGSLSLALRALTFNTPLDGMLSFHVGLEAAVGGAHWWSDGPRAAPIGGVNLAVDAGDEARAELGFEIAPHFWGDKPFGLELRKLEHRIEGRIGVGELGLRVGLVFGDEHVRGGLSQTQSTTIVIGVELRR